jgi:hypothetical protein
LLAIRPREQPGCLVAVPLVRELRGELHRRQRQPGIIRPESHLLDGERLAIGAFGIDRIVDVVIGVAQPDLLEVK